MAEKAEKAAVEEPVEEQEEELEEEESSGEEENEEYEEDDAGEVIEAKKLYKALKDPKTARAVVAALAEQVGLSAPETKQEVKESKKTIRDIVKKSLGKEYEFISDKLGDALEEVMEIERSSRSQESQELQKKTVELEVSRAMDIIARETKGDSRKYEARMSELADKYLPSPNTSHVDYIRMLYTLASAGPKEKTVKAQIADKINRNSSDVTSRTRSVDGNNIKLPDKKMSLKDSVAWAAEQLTRNNRK